MNAAKGNWYQQLEAQNHKVFLLLLLVALIMRFHTFFPVTIDYDETTYLVIADHMLNGAVLYKDVIDIKQPGIYLIFMLVQVLFGKSVLLIRLLGMFTVTGTAFLLYLWKRKQGFVLAPSLLSGVACILMFNFYFGFSSNTELFFIFCSALGFWLFFQSKNTLHYFLVGFVFGFGFIIKQLILFDFCALGLFALIVLIKQKNPVTSAINPLLLAFGFMVPYGAVHLVFYLSGYYDYYHFVTYIAPFNYSAERDWGITLKFLVDGVILYLPFFLFAFLGLRSTSWKEKGAWVVGLLLAFDILALLATGKPHPHYYLQLVLPVSFAAGELANLNWMKSLYAKKWSTLATCIICGAYLVFLGQYYHKRYILKPNRAQNIIEAIQPLLREGETFYTGDAPQMLYWVFDRTSPTPYVHSSLMLDPNHIKTLEIDVEKELTAVLDQKPDYVILSENYPHPWFKARVEKHYTGLVTVDKDRYTIYRIN